MAKRKRILFTVGMLVLLALALCGCAVKGPVYTKEFRGANGQLYTVSGDAAELTQGPPAAADVQIGDIVTNPDGTEDEVIAINPDGSFMAISKGA